MVSEGEGAHSLSEVITALLQNRASLISGPDIKKLEL